MSDSSPVSDVSAAFACWMWSLTSGVSFNFRNVALRSIGVFSILNLISYTNFKSIGITGFDESVFLSDSEVGVIVCRVMCVLSSSVCEVCIGVGEYVSSYCM